MSENELERSKAWVAGWKRASARLEQLRDEDIRNANTVAAMQVLTDAFNSATQVAPDSIASVASPESHPVCGLVSFYGILAPRGK